ncbi:Crp/Fnr family transcriptional regulator [Pseudoalteromonas sp. CO325X]|uniref:Crp/Fnr family transcriptional regulator n=1 Tax=Pseudoalteromonas sp. CO325X TaxID=1777262 RepID=UPI001F0F9C42|nr:Crp/Fnr family transcriptional regulator [Pseudoalteromonas sp. CO325X]
MAYQQLGQASQVVSEQLQQLLAHSNAIKSLEMNTHDVLLEQQQLQNYAYFVQSGVLVAACLDEQGQQHYKEFYFQGELAFIYSAWITQQPANYSLEVLKPSCLLRVPLAELAQPRWHSLTMALLQQQVLFKESKEAFLLLQSPQQRYQFLLTHRPHWLAQLSLTQVAKYLGISAVSLSRIRARLGLN